jgi:hypothetical protein
VAEISEVPVARARAEQATTVTGERFLTRGRVAALLGFLLFALTFDLVKVQDDGTVYFDFLRRVFGVDTGGVAYQIGSAFWTAPFWLASQAVAVSGGYDHFQSGQVAVTVASNVAILLVLYFGWRILRELELPRGPAVLLLALFGTPLWFYGVLQPSYKHAEDTLYATAAYWYVLRATREDVKRHEYVAAGLCLALMLATRYANLGLVVALLASLWVMQRRRAAGWIALATAAWALAVFAVPAVRHVPYGSPPLPRYGIGSVDAPALLAETGHRIALGVVGFHVYVPQRQFDLTVPAKMLFTLHRGLFLWTPLTIFATIGFVLLLRRDTRNRPFLVTLGVSALGLLVVHSFWSAAWDGYGSFSQRFLTALFAFFLVGTAEFVRRTRRYGIAVLGLCCCFSVWVGLLIFNGFWDIGNHSYVSRHTSLNQVVGALRSVTGPKISRYHDPPPYNSVQNFGRQIGVRVKDRWELYWRLVT